MLNWFLNKQIAAFEGSTNYDASYLREILGAGTGALMRFQKATNVGKDRLGLPLDVWHVVRLVGIQAEDCGSCVQLSVQLAEADGLSDTVIRATLQHRYGELADELALAARHTAATAARAPEADALREAVVDRFGKSGLVAMALALAEVKLYPTVKYALGFGKSCQRITVGGQTIPATAVPNVTEPSPDVLGTGNQNAR